MGWTTRSPKVDRTLLHWIGVGKLGPSGCGACNVMRSCRQQWDSRTDRASLVCDAAVAGALRTRARPLPVRLKLSGSLHESGQVRDRELKGQGTVQEIRLVIQDRGVMPTSNIS